MLTNVNYVQAQGRLVNAAYGGGVKAVYNLARGNGHLAELAQKVLDLMESNHSLEEAVGYILNRK